jgi:hypothetical protein
MGIMMPMILPFKKLDDKRIKMKLANIIDPRFKELMDRIAATQVSIAVAAKIKTVVADARKLSVEYEALRIKTLNELGDKKEDGSLDANEAGKVKFSEENMKQFMTKLNEALMQDVELLKLKIEDLSDVKVSAEELSLLEGLIS